MIELDSLSSSYGTSQIADLTHVCASGATCLIVCIGITPPSDMESFSVSYEGEAMTFAGGASVDNQGDNTGVTTTVWYIGNPPVGTGTVSVSFNQECNFAIAATSYSGTSSANPIFKTRCGVGQNVKELPVQSFLKTGCLTIGVGTTDKLKSYVSELTQGQFEAYDVKPSGIDVRMQGIGAYSPFDMDPVEVNNSLTEVADWAILIYGIEAS